MTETNAADTYNGNGHGNMSENSKNSPETIPPPAASSRPSISTTSPQKQAKTSPPPPHQSSKRKRTSETSPETIPPPVEKSASSSRPSTSMTSPQKQAKTSPPPPHQSSKRKRECTRRIRLTSLVKEKDFTVFYEARNNIGLSFKAPLNADIGYIYDMVCYLLEADNAAPKFHLKSNDTIYDRSYKGILSDMPPVLVLVEEDFDPDDTITNYDEVLF